MKKIFLSVAALAFMHIYVTAQNLQWAGVFGEPSHAFRISTMAVDPSGNVYSAGYFNGMPDFDPGVDSVKIQAAYYGNSFVLKLDASGNYQKTILFGDRHACYPTTLKFDAAGNYYLSGFFSGDVDLGPDSSNHILYAVGNGNNAFLMKWDASGNFVWANRWDYNKDAGGNYAQNEEGPSTDLDGNGNIYCGGHFYGTVDFDPGTSSYTLISLQDDSYISKFDTSGRFLWAKQLITDTAQSKYTVITSVAADAVGDVIAAGYFVGKTDFNPDSAAIYELNASSKQGFVVKLNANGNFLWAKKIGKDNANLLLNYNAVNAVIADASGNVYITGNFMETVNLGNITLTSNGLSDIFIAKLDANGNYLWAKSAGTFYDGEYGYKLALDATGDLVVTGNFHSTTSFDGIPVSTNGSSDIFVLKLSSSGNVIWAKGFGGIVDYERANAVATHGNDVYTAGRMTGAVNFDPNGTYLLSTGPSNYNVHSFIQKMNGSVTSLHNPWKLDATIFPNPVTDQFTVQMDATFHQANLTVYDIQGKQVMEKEIKDDQWINVSELQPGLYIVKITGTDGYVFKKLVVAR